MIDLPKREPRKLVESDTQKLIIAAVSGIPGVRVARNNVGTLTDLRGVPITYGLGTGSPDLVGVITWGGTESTWPSLELLPPIALAFGIEVKQPGKYASRAQRGWHRVALRRGMPVGVARSPDEARAFVLHLRTVFACRLKTLGRGMP